MFKSVIICFAVFFLSFSVFAKETQFIEKNIKTFLAYQKNVIKVKNGIWSIKNDLRKMAKIERWPSEKLDDKVNEVEAIREGLSYEFKSLEEYEDDEFVKDFRFVKLVLEKVENYEVQVNGIIGSHENMIVLFKDMDILIRKANNRVRQLYRTQKTIDEVYRSKRINGDNSSDLLMVSFIERRVRTQNTLQKISKIKLDLEEVKQTRKNNFALFKHSYKEYSVEESEEKLAILKQRITEIIDSLEKDIKEDKVTQRAMFLL